MDISAPLTEECLKCVICRAGRLAKAYSTAPCVCVRLRLNRAAALENVTRSCGAPLPNEHTCIYGSRVCLSPRPVAGWSAGPVPLQRSARARWLQRGLWREQKEKKKGELTGSQESLSERLASTAQRTGSGSREETLRVKVLTAEHSFKQDGPNECSRQSSGEL